VFCKDPVVEHGIQITQPEKPYIYGSKVTFQCKSGYFMIGNYLIRCEKNSIWVPIVPSCKKSICGPALILNGNIQPLQSQYETGKTAGNFGKGCLALIHIFHLLINHGKIVHGKKKYYKPGDEVDIACHGGYVLIGPSKIKYIGGKKWFPSIPNCHLS
ncbi:Complement receptor type 2, partial [Ophiophagus hannah]